MSKLEKLEITVMTKTADGLRKIARDGDMEIGEVVDRLLLKACPPDPGVAAILAMQDIVLTLSGLSEDGYQEAYAELAGAILATCPVEALDELIEDAKHKINGERLKFHTMTDEEREAFIKGMQELRDYTV